MSALDDVIAERRRQIEGEGFSADRDDAYDRQELARAAAAYAVADRHPEGRLWPWTAAWWKPRSHRENCVKACALLVAEIERLDRGGEQ